MNAMKSVTLGTLLIRLRTKCRLTQDEVADAVGVRQNTYACWESDKTDVKYTYLLKLAKAFGISVRDLLPADNSPHSVVDGLYVLQSATEQATASRPDSRDELIRLQRCRIQQLETELVDLKSRVNEGGGESLIGQPYVLSPKMM